MKQQSVLYSYFAYDIFIKPLEIIQLNDKQ